MESPGRTTMALQIQLGSGACVAHVGNLGNLGLTLHHVVDLLSSGSLSLPCWQGAVA